MCAYSTGLSLAVMVLKARCSDTTRCVCVPPIISSFPSYLLPYVFIGLVCIFTINTLCYIGISNFSAHSKWIKRSLIFFFFSSDNSKKYEKFTPSSYNIKRELQWSCHFNSVVCWQTLGPNIHGDDTFTPKFYCRPSTPPLMAMPYPNSGIRPPPTTMDPAR